MICWNSPVVSHRVDSAPPVLLQCEASGPSSPLVTSSGSIEASRANLLPCFSGGADPYDSPDLLTWTDVFVVLFRFGLFPFFLRNFLLFGLFLQLLLFLGLVCWARLMLRPVRCVLAYQRLNLFSQPLHRAFNVVIFHSNSNQLYGNAIFFRLFRFVYHGVGAA